MKKIAVKDLVNILYVPNRIKIVKLNENSASIPIRYKVLFLKDFSHRFMSEKERKAELLEELEEIPLYWKQVKSVQHDFGSVTLVIE